MAASHLNRKSIGVEIHEPYCEIAAQHLSRMKIARRRIEKTTHRDQMTFAEIYEVIGKPGHYGTAVQQKGEKP